MEPRRYCVDCGEALVEGAGYCAFCGSKVAVEPTEDSPNRTLEMPRRSLRSYIDRNAPLFATEPTDEQIARRRRVGRSVTVLVVVVFILVLVLLIPVPTNFSRSIETVSAISLFGLSTTNAEMINVTYSGSEVSGTYTTGSGEVVAFSVMNTNGTRVVSLAGSSGAFSFSADSGSYVFVAISALPESVDVTGSVQQPLLIGLLAND